MGCFFRPEVDLQSRFQGFACSLYVYGVCNAGKLMLTNTASVVGPDLLTEMAVE